MAQAGYAGNPRYLVAAAAVGCVLAGVGVARAAAVRPLAGALALAALVAVFTAGTLRDQLAEVGRRADLRAGLDRVVDAAGGRDAILRCSRVRTATEKRTMVAWRLDLPLAGIHLPPRPPAVVLRARGNDGARVDPPLDPGGYDPLARAPGWEAWASCGPAPQTRG
jgi:hypothetical protein